MDPQIIQNLRYKLQKRMRRLNSVDSSLFIATLRQFWVFFDANETLRGVAETAVIRVPTAAESAEKILKNEVFHADNEEESATIGYEVLRRVAQFSDLTQCYDMTYGYGSPSGLDGALEIIRDVFLEPFYEYVDESLDDQRAMLAVLMRYKHRSEWFYRERLWAMASEPRGGERLLALDLYAYLYDQGIDFAIEPSSLTGEVDLIAAQGSEDPLVADAKVYDGNSRGKAYLRKAFNQVYTYTQQYNEPFGYLVIYKTTERDLRLSLRRSRESVPVVVYNHKTIFLLTVDIFPHAAPVSQRGPLVAHEITEDDLINVEESLG